jgi:peptidoglycan/xylan/chitin deacetylase (PgdA/CDA1 family)
MYHRVLETTDPLLPTEPDAQRFAAEMDVVRSVGSVLPLSEAVERWKIGDLPPRALSITFDDGYANNLTVAARVLKERNLPATVFVATAYVGGGRMWNDTLIEAVRMAQDHIDLSDVRLPKLAVRSVAEKRAAIQTILGALKYLPPDERSARAEDIAARVGLPPQSLMMSEEQIRQLGSHGIEVGAHTVTHPILKSVPTEQARREIVESRSTLQAIVQAPVTLFAYPNGGPNRDYDARHVELVRAAGYSAAVSTAWGAVRAGTDRYQMPRLLPWDRGPLRYAARLLRVYWEPDAEAAT